MVNNISFWDVLNIERPNEEELKRLKSFVFSDDGDTYLPYGSGPVNSFYGNKHTEETKKLISEKVKESNKKRLPEITKKSRAFWNSPKGALARIEQSKRVLNQIPSMKGKKHSEETRKKIGEKSIERGEGGFTWGKTVEIDGVSYRSINEASRSTGLSRWRILKDFIKESQ